MQFVIFRLFGYIPSPIMFGNVIDSTCLLWKFHCGRQGGFCLVYNIEHFRLRYVGVSSALKVAAALLFFFDWLLITWRHKKEKAQASTGLLKIQGTQQPLSIIEIVSSIISLDRLSVMGWDYDNRIGYFHHDCDDPSAVDGEGHLNRGGEEDLKTIGQDSDYNSANDDQESLTGSGRESHEMEPLSPNAGRSTSHASLSDGQRAP